MDYDTIRHVADSWGLIYLLILFVGVVCFAFRPGSKKTSSEAAQIPLKED